VSESKHILNYLDRPLIDTKTIEARSYLSFFATGVMSPISTGVSSAGLNEDLDCKVNGATTNGKTIEGNHHQNGHLHINANGSSKHTSNGHANGHKLPPTAEAKANIMPIAIVGMACRLSGDVSTPDEFWELCSRARSGWSPIPEERFNNASFHHPNPGKSGCHNPTGGHFLKDDLAFFDAQFFSLTAQEAVSLDPQQRILLECTFEALENGGIPKHSIVGQDVGVFIGGSFSDYDLNNFRDTDTVPMYQATGKAFADTLRRHS
jgi:hypothetical protein